MKEKTAQTIRVVPRGEYLLTLKARGILVEGSLEELCEELYLTRRAIQYIIDALWEFKKTPPLNQVHQMFYKLLRRQGFRAHQSKQIYKYGRALVKSARENNGKKPLLKKLTVRLDKYDAQVDLEKQVIVTKLRSRVFKIRLLHSRDYIGKFLSRRWYEVVIGIDRRGRIWVAIPFRWIYNPYKPKRLIAQDTNLKQLVHYDGRGFRRVNTRFIEALSLKAHAERLQRKYPKRWRYNRRILDRIRRLRRRSRDIVVDWCRKYAKYIVLMARRSKSAIVIEDLEKLWSNTSKRNSKVVWKLSHFAYRKLLQAIITKCIEYNVPLILVNPENTSSVCPFCRAKLVYNHRLAVCRRCGLVVDRGKIGALNIYLRALKRMSPLQGVGEECSPNEQ